MQVSWVVVVVVILAGVGIVVWTSIKNHRDRKKLEHKLNEDYRDPAAEVNKGD